MSMSISNCNASAWAQRPDPTQVASKLFSKLDTKNQGYIEKSDLKTALDTLSSTSDSSASSSVDDIFSQLDGDGDGKVTEGELSDSLQKISDQLDSQFNDMRMRRGGGDMPPGDMPPPPPPADGTDTGFTKDQLTSMVSEAGSSDDKRSGLMSDIAANFSAADTDGDGKVTAKEAMAYEKSKDSSSSTSSDSTTAQSEASVMHKIMQLVHAYGLQANSSESQASSLLSVSA